MAASEKIGIPVGSGFIYETAYTGEIPEDSTIETPENRLGFIQKGATLTYKATTKSFTDDMGKVKRTTLTEEEVTFNTKRPKLSRRPVKPVRKRNVSVGRKNAGKRNAVSVTMSKSTGPSH